MKELIESIQNKLVKKIKALQQRKNREKEGLFIVEGVRFVQEIPTNYTILFYAVSDTFQKINDISVYENKNQVFIFSDDVFCAIADTQHTQGILAVCQKKEIELSHFELKENGFYILIEEIQDPGNLGTIIRTADACNVDAIFLSKGCVDLYNTKVLRSTMGSLFHIPIFSNVNLEECIDNMKQKNITIFAAHLKAKQYYYTTDFKKGCAFLIGNEGKGISEIITKRCDKLIKIPMIGQAESLNASVATGILLYEAVRQRLMPERKMYENI